MNFTMGRMTFWILLAVGTAWLLWYMVAVPGKSYTEPLKPLTAEETALRDRLWRHVVAVASREHNMFHFAALEAAAKYIEETLGSVGYEPQMQRNKVATGEVRNIEAEVIGRGRAGEIIVVGAHYDSVLGSPGANDNGSGVAATLELARLFRNRQPARTLRFVLFVNEEPPYFKTSEMGSRIYVRRAKERGENIVAMFSLETIGYYSDEAGSQHYPFPLGLFYPRTANFIAFVSNFASRPLLHEALAAFRRHAEFPSEGIAGPALVPGMDWSDHWSFWKEGYPAVMVTDTAPYRYPHYHAATDTPDRVDYERLARVTSGLFKMLQDLAGERN
jgi:Zn-dependent M28 family amino/carboxypeptidase